MTELLSAAYPRFGFGCEGYYKAPIPYPCRVFGCDGYARLAYDIRAVWNSKSDCNSGRGTSVLLPVLKLFGFLNDS